MRPLGLEGIVRGWKPRTTIPDDASVQPVDLVQRDFTSIKWVDGFNNQRLLEPIGDIPPVGFEKLYYQNQEAMAAGLTQ